MAAGDEGRLESLYFELGDQLARRHQLAEAADVYSLALYHARRSGQSDLAQLCREQILACHPNHVGARPEGAPLFYAQLLMKYPYNEALALLTKLKQEPVAAEPPSRVEVGPPSAEASRPRSSFHGVDPSGLVMASGEPAPRMAAPPTYASSGPAKRPIQADPYREHGQGGGIASLFASEPAAWSESVSLPRAEPGRADTHRPSATIGHEGFEQHHPFQHGLMIQEPPTNRAIDDALVGSPMIPRPVPAEFEEPAPVRNGWAWLEPVAGMVALAGALAIGFFAYKLWPEIRKVDPSPISREVDQAFQDAFAWAVRNEFLPSAVKLDPVPTESTGDVEAPIEAVVIDSPAEQAPPAPPSAMADAPSIPRALPPIPANDASSEWSAPAHLAREESLPPLR